MHALHSYGIIPIQKTPQGYLFLLVHNAKGHWGFPKGTPRDGETPTQTACREFEEETGIARITILKEPRYNERYTVPQPDGSRIPKTVTYFLARIDNTKPTNGIHADVQASAWCSYEEAYKKTTYPEAREILKQVKKNLNE